MYMLRKCELCGKTEGRIYTKLCKFGKELYGTCYSNMQKEAGTGKKCEVCGSTKGYVHGKDGEFGKDLCAKHMSQLRSYGTILNKTVNDHNEIVIYENHAEIIMISRDKSESGRAIIDIDDLNKIIGIKWRLHTGYAKYGSHNITIHRLVMNCPDNMIVDHINHNRLDNRKENLRICTKQQNTFNSSKRVTNTSGHTGVDFNGGKWRARIKVNGEDITLGLYQNIEDAIATRSKAIDKYFGEFAYHPEEHCGIKL